MKVYVAVFDEKPDERFSAAQVYVSHGYATAEEAEEVARIDWLETSPRVLELDLDVLFPETAKQREGVRVIR